MPIIPNLLFWWSAIHYFFTTYSVWCIGLLKEDVMGERRIEGEEIRNGIGEHFCTNIPALGRRQSAQMYAQAQSQPQMGDTPDEESFIQSNN
jgi:hypothetical protein